MDVFFSVEVREQFVLRRWQFQRYRSLGVGVGGFTDPEIDSIDAGKTFPTQEQRHSQPF